MIRGALEMNEGTCWGKNTIDSKRGRGVDKAPLSDFKF
jgi:hypothetical protein